MKNRSNRLVTGRTVATGIRVIKPKKYINKQVSDDFRAKLIEGAPNEAVRSCVSHALAVSREYE